jgi:hypothetical protein
MKISNSTLQPLAATRRKFFVNKNLASENFDREDIVAVLGITIDLTKIILILKKKGFTLDVVI